jgi:hypothetical protein
MDSNSRQWIFIPICINNKYHANHHLYIFWSSRPSVNPSVCSPLTFTGKTHEAVFFLKTSFTLKLLELKLTIRGENTVCLSAFIFKGRWVNCSRGKKLFRSSFLRSE